MFSKVKCPACGAKNLKERVTCAGCGAPLDLGQVEEQLTELSPDGKPNLVSEKRLSFSILGEKLRDKTRDKVCADLHAIGLDAQMMERDQPEENVGRSWPWHISLGLIKILGNPIRWVNVVKIPAESPVRPSAKYTKFYMVSDSSTSIEGNPQAKTVKVKSMPLIGRTIGIRWEGQLPGELMHRLNADLSLNHSLAQLKEDTKIYYSKDIPKNRYWVIVSKTDVENRYWASLSESDRRVHWECYETIARYLLEASGSTYGEKGEFDRAIADYDKAIELDPEDAAAYGNRGIAYGEKGEFDRAIADFDKVIKLDPEDALAYFNRGYVYLLKGEAVEAISDLEKCIELSKDRELVEKAQQILDKLKQ